MAYKLCEKRLLVESELRIVKIILNSPVARALCTQRNESFYMRFESREPIRTIEIMRECRGGS